MRPAIIGGDVVALSGLLGVISHALPGIAGALATVLACLWYGIQVYESDTFRHWMKRKKRHATRKAFRDWHRPQETEDEPGPIDSP